MFRFGTDRLFWARLGRCVLAKRDGVISGEAGRVWHGITASGEFWRHQAFYGLVRRTWWPSVWNGTSQRGLSRAIRGSSAVEQVPVKDEVGGSNPLPGATLGHSHYTATFLSSEPDVDCHGAARLWSVKADAGLGVFGSGRA